MHHFQDTTGRRWELNLTLTAVKRVRSLARVDLLNPLGNGRRKGRKKRQPLITRLQLDPVLLIDVIYAILQPQAEKHCVSDEDFGEALGGDAAYAAYEAFFREWQLFFRSLRRETEARVIEANRNLVEKQDAENQSLIGPATEAAEAMVERRRAAARKKLAELTARDSSTATGSPASSESTPEG